MNRIKILKDQLLPLNIISDIKEEEEEEKDKEELENKFEINFNQLNYENLIENLRGKESKFLREKGRCRGFEIYISYHI